MGVTLHQRDGHEASGAWPAASRSTASRTGDCCVRDRSRISGFSPRPAMRAARSGRRCSSGISCSTSRERRTATTSQQASLLGPRSRPTRSRRSWTELARCYRRFENEADLLDRVARACWRMRRSSAGSTGGRSSARGRSGRAASSATRDRPKMQATMNLKIKFRESFRPFAPCRAARARARVVRDASRRRLARTCCWWRRCSIEHRVRAHRTRSKKRYARDPDLRAARERGREA